jgi:metallopeptidase MepB
MIWLLKYVSPDKETRDAIAETGRLIDDANDVWAARREVFVLLKAAADKNEAFLDPESRHWVAAKMQDWINSGHGLLGASAISQYVKGRSHMDQLRDQYNRNLRSENGGLWMDRDELDGVPLEQLKRCKKQRHDGSSSGESCFVPFSNGGCKAVLSHARREATRERLFIAEQGRLLLRGLQESLVPRGRQELHGLKKLRAAHRKAKRDVSRRW